MKKEFHRTLILFIIVFSLLLTACSNEPEQVEDPVDSVPANHVEVIDPFGDAPITNIAMRAFRFQFEPNRIEATEGDHVRITISSLDVGHGFALPDFGINEKIPPEESITIDFLADQVGEFDFFSSVYSGKGYKNMTGIFVVKANPAEINSTQ